MNEALSHVALLQGVSPPGLAALAERGRERRFAAGAFLMRQGGPSDVMYIILQGRVRVERNHRDMMGPIVLAELGPGETVGEMGLLDGEPRSAAVVALEETVALELDALVLAQTMMQYPEVGKALLHVLSGRIRATDDALVQRSLRGKEGFS